MDNRIRPARLDWSDGSPTAPDFGDVYFSVAGGDGEARYVFLEQNRLPQRFSSTLSDTSFTIVETGFGTGLNWLATVSLWRESAAAGWLHFVSVDKHPLERADLERTHACWPRFADLANALQQQYPRLLPGFHRMVFPQWRTTLTLFLGDIDDFLPALACAADAWFLDGFAPDRNPAMWSDRLFAHMARLSRPDATFATFTAAGAVRRGLQVAGFSVERVAGFGQKREMLRGRYGGRPAGTHPQPWLSRQPALHRQRDAIIVGAGVAGATLAARLALRGWTITVIDRAPSIACGASGNPAAIIHPRLGPADQPGNAFAQQAWLLTVSTLSSLPLPAGIWNPCGILQLSTPHQARRARHLDSHPWQPLMMRRCDATQASAIAGVPLHHEAMWFPDGGWLNAAAFCQYLLDHPRIRVISNTNVSRLDRIGEQWRAMDDQGTIVAQGPVVILANGLGASELAVTEFLPLMPVAGQISTVAASELSARLKTVVCHDGYISPVLHDGTHCLGATFHPGNAQIDVTPDDHRSNHAQQQSFLPELADSLPTPDSWQGRTSLRCQSPDALPLVGPVGSIRKFREDYVGLRDGKVMDYPELTAEHGLYVNVAHGSKGFSQSLLTAEILASELNNEPAPVSAAVLDALHPMRFAAKDLRRRKV